MPIASHSRIIIRSTTVNGYAPYGHAVRTLALDVYAYRLLLTARLISTQPIAARIIQMLRVVPNIALELLTPALFLPRSATLQRDIGRPIGGVSVCLSVRRTLVLSQN